MLGKKVTYAIGPMLGLPSTEWVGKDVANYLNKKGSEITLFNSFDENVNTQVIFIVKQMPPLQWLISQKRRGTYLLYFPVDVLDQPWRAKLYEEHFKYFDKFLIHNHRVADELNASSDRIEFVNHYLKYIVDRKGNFKDEGTILWVGHLEYLPSLVGYLKSSDTENVQFSFLSDLENYSLKRKRVIEEIESLGVRYSESWESEQLLTLCGFKIEQWSTDRQAALLSTCRASIDTKLDSYGHNLKPPTKAQKYVFNGIPFACPKASYSSEYFRELGLEIPDLGDIDYLCSKEYFELVNKFARENFWRVSLESVANSYLEAVDIKDRRKAPKSFIYSKFLSQYFKAYALNLKVLHTLKKVITRIF